MITDDTNSATHASSAANNQNTSTAPRHTPLYNLHVELGGKMVDFAGWLMPVQYPAGIKAEHLQCRERAALFDVSHMGQIELHGDNVAARLETLVPCDVKTLVRGKARYTFFTNTEGGILDDLIVTKDSDHFYLVINASMRNQDIALLRDNLPDIKVIEKADNALLAVQGPKAADVLSEYCPAALDLSFMESMKTALSGIECRVSRLGYTGEDGFEIAMANEHADAIARALLDHEDCAPAGLGARDSLRLEAGLCLYGNDIDTTTTPVEASLLWAIQERRREQGGFPGADIIQNQIANGASRKLVGIRPDGRIPARHGVEILDTSGEAIGVITSGCFGPTVEAPVALAYVATEYSKPGTVVQLTIRGKNHPATVAKPPFVTQNYKR